MFTYGSICSGIEAATVAWKGLGKPLWFSEIDPFPCAVLAYHYPDVPNFGDMTMLAEKILKQEIPAPDVLVGGTPCQAFSVAGLRNSLDDDRGKVKLTVIYRLLPHLTPSAKLPQPNASDYKAFLIITRKLRGVINLQKIAPIAHVIKLSETQWQYL